MPARLPTPGSDAGQWGEILNNYLLQSHNPDGTLRSGSVTESKLSSDVLAKLNETAAIGATGPQGASGPAGATGPQGVQGQVGATGPQGVQGPAGATGPQGASGPAGADGRSVTITGSVPSQSSLPTGLGADDAGEGYITEDDGHLHVWSGSSWTDVGEIRGPQGPAGATGPQGDPGVQGATGPQGASGPAGATGSQGVQGQTGATGSQGTQGLTGATGPQGATGPAGTGATDATAATKGIVRLTGDLGGTADAPTVPNMVRANMGGQEMVSTNVSASGSVTLNLANGNVFSLTLTGNITSLGISGAAPGRALSFALYVQQDGVGGRTVSWPGSVQWIGDTPTLSSSPNGLSVFVFESLNGGTTWYGSAVGASAGLEAVTIADLPASTVLYTSSTTRPTSRTDVMVIFTGADPGGAALNGDLWIGS